MDAGVPRGGPASLPNDLALFGRIVWTPRQAFVSIADDRVRWVGFAVPVLVTVARLFRGDRLDVLGPVWAGVLVVIGVAVVLPLWALVVQGIVRLFRREIAFARVLNLGNYTQVPRLGAGLGLLAMEPIGRWFGADSEAALSVAVFAALGFSVYLYVRGLASLSAPRPLYRGRASGGTPPAPSPDVPAGGSSMA